MMKVIFKTIFYLSLLFLAISLWAITIGQSINFEFKNYQLANEFYNIILPGTPIAILITLFGTLKNRQSSVHKISIVLITILLTFCSFIFLLNNLFTIGFSRWSTFNIAYEHKTERDRQIREQRYDSGALGYGGNRTVEVKPFAFFFWKIIPVDTTKIDKTIWIRVDKEGDVKFP